MEKPNFKKDTQEQRAREDEDLKTLGITNGGPAPKSNDPNELSSWLHKQRQLEDQDITSLGKTNGHIE